MSREEEELEFISVNPNQDDNDDANMTQSYGVDTTSRSGYDNVVGSWILNQSKVRPQSLQLYTPTRRLLKCSDDHFESQRAATITLESITIF